MATEQLKQLIARELALGLKKADVARFHGYTPNGLYKLLQTPEMKKLCEEQLELRRARYLRSQVSLDDYVDNAMRNLLAIAGDTQHKDCYRANQFILDRVVEEKRETETRVEVNITGEVLADMQHSMKQMTAGFQNAKTIPKISEHLMEGDEALPKAIDADYSNDPEGAGGDSGS